MCATIYGQQHIHVLVESSLSIDYFLHCLLRYFYQIGSLSKENFTLPLVLLDIFPPISLSSSLQEGQEFPSSLMVTVSRSWILPFSCQPFALNYTHSSWMELLCQLVGTINEQQGKIVFDWKNVMKLHKFPGIQETRTLPRRLWLKSGYLTHSAVPPIYSLSLLNLSLPLTVTPIN